MSSDAAAERRKQPTPVSLGAVCPIPIHKLQRDRSCSWQRWKVEPSAHGENGAPAIRNELLEPLHDGAIFSIGGQRVAFSTDSYVVSPIFFRAVTSANSPSTERSTICVMCGARPLYLSVGFILERRHTDGRSLARCAYRCARPPLLPV